MLNYRLEKEDTRVPVKIKNKASTKNLFNLQSLSYEALSCRPYELNAMKARIRESKSAKQTLSILKDYVRFEQ